MRHEPPRPGRPPRFGRDQVIEAAVALVHEVGLEGLSMRNLAKALHTTPATIYRNVDNQEDLVALVCDAVLSKVTVPPAIDDESSRQDEIREWLRLVAQEFRSVMLRYPGVADQLLLTGPTGPVGLRAMATICKVLALTGRNPTEVAYAYDWLMTTVAVYTSKEGRLDSAGGADLAAAALAARSHDHDDQHLIEVLGQFTGDMHEAFERTTGWVIDAIMDGRTTAG